MINLISYQVITYITHGKNTNKHKYSMIVSLYNSLSFPPIPSAISANRVRLAYVVSLTPYRYGQRSELC